MSSISYVRLSRVKFLQKKEVGYKATDVWTEALLDVHLNTRATLDANEKPCTFLPPSQTAPALQLIWLTALSSHSSPLFIKYRPAVHITNPQMIAFRVFFRLTPLADRWPDFHWSASETVLNTRKPWRSHPHPDRHKMQLLSRCAL